MRPGVTTKHKPLLRGEKGKKKSALGESSTVAGLEYDEASTTMPKSRHPATHIGVV
jgi:hypothetical protein